MNKHEGMHRRDFLKLLVGGGLGLFLGPTFHGKEERIKLDETDHGIQYLRDTMLTVENTKRGREELLDATAPMLSYLLTTGTLHEFALGSADPETPYGFRIYKDIPVLSPDEPKTEETHTHVANTVVLPQYYPYLVEIPTPADPHLHAMLRHHGSRVDEMGNRFTYRVYGPDLASYIDTLNQNTLIQALVYGNEDPMIRCELDVHNPVSWAPEDLVSWYRDAGSQLFVPEYMSANFPLIEIGNSSRALIPELVTTTARVALDVEIPNTQVELSIGCRLADSLGVTGDHVKFLYEKGHHQSVPELLSVSAVAAGADRIMKKYAFRRTTPQEELNELRNGLQTYPFRFPLSQPEKPGMRI